ncbi:MAG: hypothetical protein KDD60_07635 [Bdellovibrionales bacterium]|nr:hypothetical protein [Bdellovibrionales bacterium]
MTEINDALQLLTLNPQATDVIESGLLTELSSMKSDSTLDIARLARIQFLGSVLRGRFNRTQISDLHEAYLNDRSPVSRERIELGVRYLATFFL